MKRNRNKLHRAHRQYLAVAVDIDLHHLVVLFEVELHMATVAKTHK